MRTNGSSCCWTGGGAEPSLDWPWGFTSPPHIGLAKEEQPRSCPVAAGQTPQEKSRREAVQGKVGSDPGLVRARRAHPVLKDSSHFLRLCILQTLLWAALGESMGRRQLCTEPDRATPAAGCRGRAGCQHTELGILWEISCLATGWAGAWPALRALIATRCCCSSTAATRRRPTHRHGAAVLPMLGMLQRGVRGTRRRVVPPQPTDPQLHRHSGSHWAPGAHWRVLSAKLCCSSSLSAVAPAGSDAISYTNILSVAPRCLLAEADPQPSPRSLAR